ncbi:unnamed protein product, partial [Acanthoscelides obtectus]
ILHLGSAAEADDSDSDIANDSEAYDTIDNGNGKMPSFVLDTNNWQAIVQGQLPFNICNESPELNFDVSQILSPLDAYKLFVTDELWHIIVEETNRFAQQSLAGRRNSKSSFPCLWQVKSAEYSDRNKKSQAYEIMIKKYKEIDEAANKGTVTKKINSLRTVYKKERAKIMKSTKSGAGEDDIYNPTLWYFDLLDLLNDQDQIRQSTNTIDDEAHQEKSEKEVDLDYQSFPATPSTGRPSTPTSDTATSALLPTRTVNRKKKAASNNNETAEVSKINKKLDLLQKDSHDRFGKHVADRLRSVHPDQLKFAMKLISDVLFKADILSLNRYSKIITEDQHPPQQSPRETRKPHFNQYAPPCVTNTEPNRQISSQGWRQGYYVPEIGQEQHVQQLQLIHNSTTPEEPANTNFTLSDYRTPVSEKDTDSNPKDLVQYVLNFKPNEGV